MSSTQKAGYNPGGAPGQGFDPVAEGHYVIGPPQFSLAPKQRDSGPMWVGGSTILEVVKGDEAMRGERLPVFAYDPLYDMTALGRLRITLARHGCSPSGLLLGEMSDLMDKVNTLARFGQPAHILVGPKGYIKESRVEGVTHLLVVFESWHYYDMENDWFGFVIEESKRFFNKDGKPNLSYRCDPLLRVVSDGPWQNHLVTYAFLNYTLSAYMAGETPMLAPSGGSEKQSTVETNFTRFCSACGVDLASQVVEDAHKSEFLTQELFNQRIVFAATEAEDPYHRPHILDWIQHAALVMRDQGHVMVGKVDEAKGYVDGRSLTGATAPQIKKLGMPKAIPVLLTWADVQDKTPPELPGHTGVVKIESLPILPMDQVVAMYNDWSMKVFECPVFEMKGAKAVPIKSATVGDKTINPIDSVLIPFALPIFAWQAGQFGVTREASCRMNERQMKVISSVLHDEEYHKAVTEGDKVKIEEIIRGHYDTVYGTGSVATADEEESIPF